MHGDEQVEVKISEQVERAKAVAEKTHSDDAKKTEEDAVNSVDEEQD